jgi:hypothetical protein
MAQFNRDWNTGIVQHLAGTGISRSQIDQLSRVSDPRQRLVDLQHLLSSTSSNNGQNTVQKRTDPQTVKLEFTGAAAKWFQSLNNSTTDARHQANAGIFSYNNVVNAPGGDPQARLTGRALGLAGG